MSDRPDLKDRDSETVGEQVRGPVPDRSRTMAAGREFLAALGNDVRRLGRNLVTGLRKNLAAARWRRSRAAERGRREGPCQRVSQARRVVRARPLRSRWSRGWVRTGGWVL